MAPTHLLKSLDVSGALGDDKPKDGDVAKDEPKGGEQPKEVDVEIINIEKPKEGEQPNGNNKTISEEPSKDNGQPTDGNPPKRTELPKGGNESIASANKSESSSADSAQGDNTLAKAGITVSLVREPSIQESGIISVSVPKDMATAGSGFSFPLPEQITVNAAANNIGVTLVNGKALPTWLKFVPATKTFVAIAVPDGAFPVQLLVTAGGKVSTIVISARAE